MTQTTDNGISEHTPTDLECRRIYQAMCKGYQFVRHPDDPGKTAEGNARSRWSVQRTQAPFGIDTMIWIGPDPINVLDQAVRATGVEA